MFSTSALLGCSASGPKFSSLPAVSDGSAILYIYRNANFSNSARSVEVLVDEKPIGNLANNGYLAVRVSRGPHEVRLRLDEKYWKGNASNVFSAASGESIYLRVDTSYSTDVKTNMTSRTFSLSRAPEAVGATEIVETSQSNK